MANDRGFRNGNELVVGNSGVTDKLRENGEVGVLVEKR